MALFKLRKKVDEPKAAAAPAESIEAVRRRARHRLIGAAVLVLAGVIGFPLLFDTQPRPVAVDIPIEIPDRHQTRPLAMPSSPAPVSSGKVTPAPAPAVAAAVAVPPPAPESKPEPAPAPAAKPEARPAATEKLARTDPAAEKKAEPRAEPAPAPKPAAATESAKARALLEGTSVDASGARYVVQVGAFAEREKAQQAQQKLERAGLKNYTNVADTRDGKRIRVRAGPFTSRAEADRAAEKIKGLDLPAAVLTL